MFSSRSSGESARPQYYQKPKLHFTPRWFRRLFQRNPKLGFQIGLFVIISVTFSRFYYDAYEIWKKGYKQWVADIPHEMEKMKARAISGEGMIIPFTDITFDFETKYEREKAKAHQDAVYFEMQQRYEASVRKKQENAELKEKRREDLEAKGEYGIMQWLKDAVW